MLRTAAGKLLNSVGNAAIRNSFVCQSRLMGHHNAETDEEFDCRIEAYLNRPEIDGWEIRKVINDLAGMDLIPEPRIIIAGLKACRRINDFALTIRWLEAIRIKSNAANKAIYPYILQEIRPTLDELGINTPEEMGYDKPELALPLTP